MKFRLSLGNIKRYKPYRDAFMSDEPQFVFLLPEMIHQQREPDDQGCRPHNDGQGHQG